MMFARVLIRLDALLLVMNNGNACRASTSLLKKFTKNTRDIKEKNMAAFKDVFDDFMDGKSVRRSKWHHEITIELDLISKVISGCDLSANDWSVVEKEVTITESDFDQALEKVLEKSCFNGSADDVMQWNVRTSLLKKELGL